MWDVRKQFSLGRYLQRHVLLVATALVVAVFAILTAFAQPALAADALRSGDSVSYDNKTFTVLNLQGNPPDKLPTGLPSSTTGYRYLETSANKTHFILTTGDPAKATTGQYVTYSGTPPQNYTSPSAPETVSIVNAPNSLDEAASGTPTQCDGKVTGGIGWILCPTVNLLATGMDNLYGILVTFLTVPPIDMDTNSSIHRMWAVIRDLANICFVIAFLLIVYSQVTSVGISNYGIKRMLPRLIIAAILVNTSFLISALGVDISNLLGKSIHELFMNFFAQFNTASQYQEVTWSRVTTYILSGGTAAAAIGFGGYALLAGSLSGSLMLLIPSLVGVLFAVLVAILVLAARQALIICLVIISPLAFVAYLLPNTEKYFDKWRGLFMTMLIMFPAFSLIFAGAQLAGLAIIQSAGQSLNLVILGMVVMVAPIVVTPLLVKLSGSLLGRIAGLVNNPKKGAVDRTRNWAQARQQERKAAILAGKGRNTWANRATQAIDRKRRRRDGWRKADEAVADTEFAATSHGMAIEAQNRATSARKVEIDNAFGRTATGRRLEYRSQTANNDKSRVENEFRRSYYGQRVDAENREVGDEKKMIENDQSYRYATSAIGRANDLHLHDQQHREEARKADAERHISELTANQSTDGYYGNFETNGHLRVRGAQLAQEFSETRMKVALDSMAKRNAEMQQQNNIATAIEDNQTHTILNGQTTRQYAAGISGTQGEASALAGALTTSREQFGKFSSEYEDLRDKYMPPFSEIKDFLTGKSKTLVFKDEGGNEVISVDTKNPYAVNAMVKHITSIGVVDDVDKMIELSGKNGPLHEYRETVADVLAQKGYGSRSIYEGGQVIELVRQGQIASHTDLIEHVQGQLQKGKVSPSDLSTLDASAIHRFQEAIHHPRRKGTNDAGAEIKDFGPEYVEKVAAFIESAHTALNDPRLKNNIKDNAREELLKVEAAYQALKDGEGKVDPSRISLDDIRSVLPPAPAPKD